jgi:hypothetical protein
MDLTREEVVFLMAALDVAERETHMTMEQREVKATLRAKLVQYEIDLINAALA